MSQGPPSPPPPRAAPDFLAGGGEMGARARAHDWSASPLGPPQGWPQGLRAVVRPMLTSEHPMFVFWGPKHLRFHNDACSVSLGPEKHPAALGALKNGRPIDVVLSDVMMPGGMGGVELAREIRRR